MKCPLCHTPPNSKEQIDTQILHSLYLKQYGIDISDTIIQELYYCHCTQCDFRFFALKDGTIPTGNNIFYNALNKIPWYYFSEKHEYDYTKQFIKDGNKVLEVGCGKAAFAKYIPQAQYTGLEFSTDAKQMAKENGVSIENISIQDYVKSHPQEVNVVCSFQVLEHVSDPHSFIQSKIDACKGGGVYYHSRS